MSVSGHTAVSLVVSSGPFVVQCSLNSQAAERKRPHGDVAEALDRHDKPGIDVGIKIVDLHPIALLQPPCRHGTSEQHALACCSSRAPTVAEPLSKGHYCSTRGVPLIFV